ncbi:MAG TPA: enoyl-CoA hydratase [Acidimicrobiaceae bacterium]|nr:enoyl-CoA hydratase [Acidimicrobiaceae bacterium]
MDTLQVERDGGIVTVTLNKPQKKNAVDPTQWTEMARIWDEIARNPRRDRAVIVTGAGGDFCSGADLWLDPGEEPPHQITAMRNVSAAIQGLHDLPQPTIAKVPGVAAGAGCSLALACDLVVAGDEARFAETFPKRGLAVDGGSSWFLPRMIGLHRAKELAFFGDIISAADAEGMGLVNRVVPDAELDSFVQDWASRLASGPPIALGLTKRMLNESANRTLQQALEAEAMAQSITLQSKDTQDAFAAFVEKRDPDFRGR